MTVTVTDAAYAYLTDAAIRAAVDEVIAYDTKKSGYLPWTEARELARARVMAELARADVLDLLFQLWERAWDGCAPMLGTELPEDDDNQSSFLYKDIWEYQELGRSFNYRGDQGNFVELYISMNIDESHFQVVALKGDDKRYYQWKHIDGWKRQAEDEELEEGLVCEEVIPFSALHNNFENHMQAIRRHVDALVASL